MAKQEKQPKTEESEVWSAICAFEQILEAIPNDRASIETLAHAYEQIGDHAHARDYLVRLADIVLGESDRDAAQDVLARLNAYADDTTTKDVVARLDAFIARTPDAKPAEDQALWKAAPAASSLYEEHPRAGGHAATGFNIANELRFAWRLLHANEVTQEEYSNIVQDLTEMSSAEGSVTVSVLHVLHDRGFKNLERVAASVAKDCGTPLISLSLFEPQQNAYSLLPWNYMARRGVAVFDLLGRDALVAVMNPYDKQLMKEVETRIKRRCHFFLTLPADFDGILSKIAAAPAAPA